MHRQLADAVSNCIRYVLVLERTSFVESACCYFGDETAIGAHSRHPISIMVGLVFHPSERRREPTSRVAGVESRAVRAPARWRSDSAPDRETSNEPPAAGSHLVEARPPPRVAHRVDHPQSHGADLCLFGLGFDELGGEALAGLQS